MKKFRILFATMTLFLATQCEAITANGYFLGSVASWKGIGECSFFDNDGIYAGANFVVPLWEKNGIGAQGGGSIGYYDFDARTSPVQKLPQYEVQGFVTVGLFKRSSPCSCWSAGVVHDWMIDRDHGHFGSNPNTSQLRVQAGYLINEYTEIGAWGAIRTRTDYECVNGITTTFRPINQAHLYVRYSFLRGGETLLWAGVPVSNRLATPTHPKPGKPGNFILGAILDLPMYFNWACHAEVSYMHTNSCNHVIAPRDYSANISVGITYFFGGNPLICREQICGPWMPYQPLASNSTFFMDTDLIFRNASP